MQELRGVVPIEGTAADDPDPSVAPLLLSRLVLTQHCSQSYKFILAHKATIKLLFTALVVHPVAMCSIMFREEEPVCKHCAFCSPSCIWWGMLLLLL